MNGTLLCFLPLFKSHFLCPCVCRSTSVCALRSWVTVITVCLESRSLSEDTLAPVWRWASVWSTPCGKNTHIMSTLCLHAAPQRHSCVCVNLLQVRASGAADGGGHEDRRPLGFSSLWRSGYSEVAVWHLELGRGHRQQSGGCRSAGVRHTHTHLYINVIVNP